MIPSQRILYPNVYWTQNNLVVYIAEEYIVDEGVRHRRSPHKPFRLTSSKVCTLMGLVVDQGVREGDSPGLPSSNTSIEIDRRSHDMSRKQDLIDITLRTMVLLRRNQILQKRLNALQNETRAFVKSTLNNQQNGHSMSIDKWTGFTPWNMTDKKL